MPNRTASIRDRSGVALPMALLALVIISVLVTAALVSSSTEVAVSNAQQDATRGVYTAEEGLNFFVGRVDSSLTKDPYTPLMTVDSPYALPSGSNAYVVPRLMYRTNPTSTTSPGSAVYCVTSTEIRSANRSSRTLGGFMQFALNADTLNLKINGAGSFGGEVKVTGSGKITGQAANVSLCGANGAIPAIEVSGEGSVSSGGSAQLVGGTNKTTETKEQFQKRILGGRSLMQIAKAATIKFGPLLTDERVFPSRFKANASLPKDSVTNWGCPGSMGVTCTGAYADTSYYPVIAIDAQNDVVDLQGDYGQGLLVVVNGGLKITGNFQFKGIILVEGALDVMGTVDVRGAVVGFQTITVARNDNQNDLAGNMNITFDPCVNKKVQEQFNVGNPMWAMSRPLYGWFEVVK